MRRASKFYSLTLIILEMFIYRLDLKPDCFFTLVLSSWVFIFMYTWMKTMKKMIFSTEDVSLKFIVKTMFEYGRGEINIWYFNHVTMAFTFFVYGTLNMLSYAIFPTLGATFTFTKIGMFTLQIIMSGIYNLIDKKSSKENL